MGAQFSFDDPAESFSPANDNPGPPPAPSADNPIAVPLHNRSFDPSQEAQNLQAGQQQIAIEQQEQRRSNLVTGEQLATRGIPAQMSPNGNVQPVLGENGMPLSNLDARNHIAYDNTGQPKALSMNPDGSTKVADPFAGIPDWTDTTTGDVYKRRNGLPWKWVGEDDATKQQIHQQQVDKLNQQTATAMGGPITQLHADYNETKVAAKTALTGMTKSGLVPMYDANNEPIDYANTDPETLKQSIAAYYDDQLAQPAANQKGWFGDDLTADAQAERSKIEANRDKAMQIAGDYMGKLGQMQQYKANVDKLESQREELQSGRLDAINEKRVALGLSPIDIPKTGTPTAEAPAASPIANLPPASQEALSQAQQGNKLYGFNPEKGVQFKEMQGNLVQQVRQAENDGILTPEQAKAAVGKAAIADQLDQVIKTAGGAQLVKSFGKGLGVGAAFAAGSIPGAKAGAAAGAAIPGLGETGISELVLGGIGALTTGTIAAWGAKGLFDKLNDYSETVRSINASAALHPTAESVGELTGMVGTSGPKSISNIAEVAKIAGKSAETTAAAAGLDAAAQATAKIRAAAGAAAKIAGSGAVGGAAFEGVLRPAFDAARYSMADQLGIQHDPFQSPTLQSLATNIGLGIITAGHNIAFKDYTPNEIASIMTRAKMRNDMGVGLGENVEPGRMAQAAQNMGADISKATDLSRPLSKNEAQIWNELEKSANAMKASGKFDSDVIKSITARQANIPTLGSKEGTPLAAATIETEATPPAGPGLGGGDRPAPEGPTPEKPVTGREIVPAEPAAIPSVAEPTNTPPSEAPQAEIQKASPEPTEPTAASQSVAEKLSTLGYEQSQIDKMSPAEAERRARQGIAAKPAETPVNTVAYELKPITPIADVTWDKLKDLGYSDDKIRQMPDEQARRLAYPDAGTSPAADSETKPATPGGEQGVDTKAAGASPAVKSEFTTAKGSKYQFHEDGTTTRDKAARAEHPGDFGLKERSSKTVFVSPEMAHEVGMWQSSSATNKRIILKDGKVMMVSKASEGANIGRDNTVTGTDESFSTEPEIGKHPLELWKPDENGMYAGNHPGTAITTVNGVAKPEEKAQVTPQHEHTSQSEPGQGTGVESQGGKSDSEQPGDATNAGRPEPAPPKTSLARARSDRAVEKAKAFQEPTANILGVVYKETAASPPGIETHYEFDDKGALNISIGIDGDKMADSWKSISGGAAAADHWTHGSLDEEMAHYRGILASGAQFNEIHEAVWKLVPVEAKEEFAKVYGPVVSDAHGGAEWMRMLSQQRRGVDLPERSFTDVSKLAPFLDSEQPHFIEDFLAQMETLVAEPGEHAAPKSEVAETPSIKAKPEPKKSRGPPAKVQSATKERSSTQFTLSPKDAASIQKFAKSIPETDLYHGEQGTDSYGTSGYGIEDESHVTALYGITHDDAKAIRERVKGNGPVKFTLGKITKFSNPDAPYDVLKIDVAGKDLHAINATLKKEPYQSDYPDYHPHITIAYVKKGMADKYVGDDRFEGQEITAPVLTFSDRNRVKTKISLGQKPTISPKSETVPPKSGTKPSKREQATEPVPKKADAPIVIEASEKKGEQIPQKPTTVLNDATHIKISAPKGVTTLRVTDGKGRQTVEAISSLNKGMNIFHEAGPFKKLESGIINSKKQFVPMSGPVSVEDISHTIPAAKPNESDQNEQPTEKRDGTSGLHENDEGTAGTVDGQKSDRREGASGSSIEGTSAGGEGGAYKKLPESESLRKINESWNKSREIAQRLGGVKLKQLNIKGFPGLAMGADGNLYYNAKALSDTIEKLNVPHEDVADFIKSAFTEEFIHRADALTNNPDVLAGDDERQAIFESLPEKTQSLVRDAYGDFDNRTLGAEYIRMLSQSRMGINVTESFHKDTSELEKELQKQQPKKAEIKVRIIIARLGENPFNKKPETLPAAKPYRAVIPAEKMTAFTNLAHQLAYQNRILTPEELGEELSHNFEDKIPYSNAIWHLMGVIKPNIRDTSPIDWNRIYGNMGSIPASKPKVAPNPGRDDFIGALTKPENKSYIASDEPHRIKAGEPIGEGKPQDEGKSGAGGYSKTLQGGSISPSLERVDRSISEEAAKFPRISFRKATPFELTEEVKTPAWMDVKSGHVVINPRALSEECDFLDSLKPGLGEVRLRMAMDEEETHLFDLKATAAGNKKYGEPQKSAWVESPDYIKKFFSDLPHPINRGAEIIRILDQLNRGEITEESTPWKPVNMMKEAFHQWDVPQWLSDHLVKMTMIREESRTPLSGTLSAANPAKAFYDEDVRKNVKRARGTIAQAMRQIQAAFNPMSAVKGEDRQVGLLLREDNAKIQNSSDVAQAVLRSAAKLFDRGNKSSDFADSVGVPSQIVQKDASTGKETVRKLAERERFAVAFMHAVERPDEVPNLPPELSKFRDQMRVILDEKRDEAMSEGALQTFIDNYFPHVWENPEKAKAWLASYFGKAPMRGSGSFRKKRVIPTILEGIKAGLIPASFNPVDLVIMKRREMDKWITMQRVIDEYKERGMAKYVKASDKLPEGYSEIKDPAFIVHGPREIEVTARNSKLYDEDNNEVDPKEAGVEIPPDGHKLTVKLPAKMIMGRYAMPTPLADIVNNFLSPGLRQKSDLFKAYLGVANVLNQFQLGFSFFHLGFTTLDSMVSQLGLALEQLFKGEPLRAVKSAATVPAAPFTTFVLGNKIIAEWLKPGSQGAEIGKIFDAVIAGGGRAQMDEIYKTQITKRMTEQFRSGNLLGGILRIPFAVVEQASRPVLEYIVPRMKMGIFAHMMQDEMRRAPDMNRDQLRESAAKAWDSVDNRMGQLVYDNLFWNKAVKDALMGSLRSLGWNLGTFREVGGGLLDLLRETGAMLPRVHIGGGGRGGQPPEGGKSGGEPLFEAGPVRIVKGRKPEFTHRMAYALALPLLVGILGAMMMKLLTGKNPDEIKDLYFPQVGGKDAEGNPMRIALPSYMKDIFAYREGPLTTLSHKLHPMLSMIAEMLQNKDYYGKMIRNSDDPIIRQALDELKYVGKGFVPFSARGIQEMVKTGATPEKAALPFIGITPAPKYINQTDAEKLAHSINAARMPNQPVTEQEFERRVAKTDLVRQVRQGNYSAIPEALRSGTIRPTDVPLIEKKAQSTPLQNQIRTMTYLEAQRVFNAATPSEKAQILPMMNQKKARAQQNTMPAFEFK